MNARHFSLVLLTVCFIAGYQVAVIPPSPMFSVVDATFFPALISGTLLISVLLYCLASFRAKPTEDPLNDDQSPLKGAPTRVWFFLSGMLLCLLFVKPLGYVVGSVVAGLGIARAFDARLDAKAVMIVLGTAICFWVLFDQILQVNLGGFLLPVLQGT